MLSIAAVVFTGCGKYEDGPAFSLRSKNARLQGEWELTEAEGPDFTYNGSVYTYIDGYEFTYTYSMTLEKDGTFESEERIDSTLDVDKGYWSWRDGASSKELLDLPDYALSYDLLKVVKLTSKELVLSAAQDDGDVTYVFEKK
jgi:hypothetical protein